MKSKKYNKNNSSTPSKKYKRDLLSRLEYISLELFGGGTIVYPNNYILSCLLDIPYDDKKIDIALKELEKERSIIMSCKQIKDYKDFPFEWWIDVIPF